MSCKFNSISELIKKKVDIFLINKVKLGETFPKYQHVMPSHKFVRKDTNKFEGGVVFISVINWTVKTENHSEIKALTIEMTKTSS